MYNFFKIKEIRNQRVKDHKLIDYLKTRLAIYESGGNFEEELNESSVDVESLSLRQPKGNAYESYLKEEREGLNTKIQELIQSIKFLTYQKDEVEKANKTMLNETQALVGQHKAEVDSLE